MPKKLLIYLFLFLTFHSYSQNERKNIYGIVTSDSAAVKDVHVFNMNSRKGTISNQYGEFRIPVKLNDTLLISDIQFVSQKIIITQSQLDHLQLNIQLKQQINELNEVTVKEHNLTGNLHNDAESVKDNNKVNKALREQDAFKPDIWVVDNIDGIDREKAPDSRKLTDPTAQASQGNVLGLLKQLGLKSLIYGVSQIGKKKRVEKREQKRYELNHSTAPDKIRNELGDLFFTKTLKIPASHIDPFINYCDKKGIIDTYLNGNKIATIDLLIKESSLYLKELKNEK